GGPKWFTLFGLDKYIFGDFFAKRKDPLYTIGSSAGSWRMACFGSKDPVKSITRLADLYSHETYEPDVTIEEVTQSAVNMLDKVLKKDDIESIVNNKVIQTHFIVAKAKGLNKSENKWIQSAGLLTAATANYFSRNNLTHFFDRYIFHTQNKNFKHPFFQLIDLPTHFVPASTKSIQSILIASGAIPLVINGVTQIDGAPEGIYRDGGIIDYHLDLNFFTNKLVLYPHFFPIVKPGWFDKAIKKRNASINNYDNVVLVTPSASHVESLPYKKISDRTDFKNLDDDSRIKYWQTVLSESHKMADDFKLLVEKGEGIGEIKDIEGIL
ncbi:MAG: patatin-like phospholipase family protein, partial [Gammaproteobacteria bacterium]|nr:patatin-like phospholipase family protein [Gammaproteobacteria bacterium]